MAEVLQIRNGDRGSGKVDSRFGGNWSYPNYEVIKAEGEGKGWWNSVLTIVCVAFIKADNPNQIILSLNIFKDLKPKLSLKHIRKNPSLFYSL